VKASQNLETKSGDRRTLSIVCWILLWGRTSRVMARL